MDQENGARLARYARACIRHALGGSRPEAPSGAWAEAPGATFVTLTQKNGELHGCVGSLEPRRSIASDVRENAIAAALDDPRAPPIELEDAGDLDVEVSVLSPLEPIAIRNEIDALARIAGSRGGVVLRAGGRRATFLPQMWERLPDPSEFLLQLKRKAGLADDAWPADARIWRYTAQTFHDRARPR